LSYRTASKQNHSQHLQDLSTQETLKNQCKQLIQGRNDQAGLESCLVGFHTPQRKHKAFANNQPANQLGVQGKGIHDDNQGVYNPSLRQQNFCRLSPGPLAAKHPGKGAGSGKAAVLVERKRSRQMPGKSVREASTHRGKLMAHCWKVIVPERRSTALPPERQFKLDPPPKMFFSSNLLLRRPFCLGFCACRDPEPALEPLMLHQVMHLAGSPGKV